MVYLYYVEALISPIGYGDVLESLNYSTIDIVSVCVILSLLCAPQRSMTGPKQRLANLEEA